MIDWERISEPALLRRISQCQAFGTIDDYWCIQDELERTIQYLMNALNQGHDTLRLVRNSTGPTR